MTDRLLVVEDDQDIIALLKVNLAELGLPIDYFSDGALACQAALNNDYILMLLDIMLPNVNGLDICRQVRQAKAEQANVILNIDVAHEVLLVNSDVEKIERVLTNLIDNAIRHTPEEGEVCLKTSVQDQQITILVCDTGVGIAIEDLEHIFTPRYQGSNQQVDQQSHGGLGLAICAQLVGKLGSQLNAQSQLGHGAQFSFALSQVHL